MKRHFLALSSWLLVLTAPAWAGPSPSQARWAGPPPSKARYVDPQAPCFRWPAVDFDADGVFDRIDHCPDTPPGCTVGKWGCSSDSDGDGVCDGRDQCPDTPKGMKVDRNGCQAGAHAMNDTHGQEAMPKEVSNPPAPVPAPAPPASESERQLVERGRIRLENVYFETGSAVLLPESEASLNEAGTALEKFPDLRIEVEGHTDTRGPSAFNMRLSQSRSESVRAYLLHHFQLQEGNLSAKGYGETRPETRERNEEELLRNRRVELRVLNPEVLPKSVKVDQPH
jgi:OOP family OmpA-OmpF porin